MRHYLSFGGGIQSTAIALMALDRDPRLLAATGGAVPELYLFADTGHEPASVYRTVDTIEALAREAGAAFRRVRREGETLGGHVLTKAARGEGGISVPPFHVAMMDGRSKCVRHGCSRDFKSKPLDKAAKEHFAAEVSASAKGVSHWYGISLDEMTRMRVSQDGWRDLRYVLVDMRWRRAECSEYLRQRGVEAAKSSCVFCPFHSDTEWTRLRRDEPDGFDEAVEFEQDLHRAFDEHGHVAGLRNKPYLHRSRVPLGEIDKFTQQGDLFDTWDQECAGICGV